MYIDVSMTAAHTWLFSMFTINMETSAVSSRVGAFHQIFGRGVQQAVSKRSKDRFLTKIKPILAQIISRTKCDRDKLIFSSERGGQ